MPDIEVFGDSEPITNETRRHSRIYKGTNWPHVEIWVDDHLVYRSEEPTKEESLEDKQAREAYAKLEG